MSLYKDYVAFVDGGSPVPYHMDNAKYFIKPNIYSDIFEYEFKIFYKSYNSYYVGIACSQFVRKIHASDFKMMKELAIKKDKSVKKLVQLSFDF